MKRSLRSWLWGVPVEQEVEEEISFHLEMRVRELIAGGMDPATARETALARAGDLARLRERCVELGRKRDREMRLTQWLEEFRDDVKFAVRQLKGSPGFAFVAVLTLALGIGANSAIFALADVTLLRPLPFRDPDRLVAVFERTASTPRMAVSILSLEDVANQSRSFDGLAAIELGAGGGPLVTAPNGTSDTVERQSVTARFFDVLGVLPIAGRTFHASDEASSANVVVFSESLWRGRFNADASLIGGTVKLNGVPYTVLGVVPDHTQLTRPARMWTLRRLRDVSERVRQRSFRVVEVVGRLRLGVTLESARADVAAIGARIAREHPDMGKGFALDAEPVRDWLMGPDLRRTSLLMLAVVGFVLLMCCANVANLLLARTGARGRELAVRTALGAGRARVVAQMLTESFVLAAAGGVLGLAAGAAILRVAPAVIPPGLIPPGVALQFDARVAAFGLVAVVVAGIVFGLVPAWHATGRSLVQTIASAGRSTTQEDGRLRRVLVSGEIAAAVLLLCGAGLLLRTLLVLVSIDSGYRAESDRVLTLDFSLPAGPGTRYPTSEALLRFYDTVAREVSALPEARSVGWASSLPYGTTELGQWSFEIVGAPAADAVRRPAADYAAVSPGYFITLDLPVVAGRAFSERDTADSTQVCIVNEAFVRHHLQGRDPIGVRIALTSIRQGPRAEPLVKEVVGVARQVIGRPDDPEDTLQVYVPLSQHATGDVYLLAQPAAGRAEALTPLVRTVVARHDADTPVRRDRTLEVLSVQATAGYRFRAAVAGTFAGLALLLAMVGVFGILGYAVQQRQREFGVRIALGARSSSVVWLVTRSVGPMIASGAVAGLVIAAFLTRVMSAFLFRVQPLDPVTFSAVAVVLVGTAIVATAVPALRATRVDPVVALRSE